MLNDGTFSCECPSGTYDNGKDCVQCSTSQYWDSTDLECKSCGQGCAACADDSGECTECNATFVPTEAEPVPTTCSCPADTFHNGTECVAYDDCTANQYQGNEGCLNCGTNCDTCDDFTGSCNQCAATYVPSTEGIDCQCDAGVFDTGSECVAYQECAQGTYLNENDNTCVACETDCLACT